MTRLFVNSRLPLKQCIILTVRSLSACQLTFDLYSGHIQLRECGHESSGGLVLQHDHYVLASEGHQEVQFKVNGHAVDRGNHTGPRPLLTGASHSNTWHKNLQTHADLFAKKHWGLYSRNENKPLILEVLKSAIMSCRYMITMKHLFYVNPEKKFSTQIIFSPACKWNINNRGGPCISHCHQWCHVYIFK